MGPGSVLDGSGESVGLHLCLDLRHVCPSTTIVILGDVLAWSRSSASALKAEAFEQRDPACGQRICTEAFSNPAHKASGEGLLR